MNKLKSFQPFQNSNSKFFFIFCYIFLLILLSACGSGNVSLAPTPKVPTPAPPNISNETVTYMLGNKITPLLLTNTGGNVTGCTVDKIASGLNVIESDNSCKIYGTPTVTHPTLTSTITASNSGGTDTVKVYITVIEAGPPKIADMASQNYIKGSAISDINFINLGGTMLSSCTITPKLPTGLKITVSKNAGTCVISGTPVADYRIETYKITATNNNGSDHATVQISIDDALPALTSNAAKQVYTMGKAITVFNFINTGGDVVSCSAAPALPTGVTVKPTTINGKDTCQISGTPSTVPTNTDVIHTITANNSKGSDAANIKVTVISAAPKLATVQDRYFLTNQEADTVTITSTGGKIVRCDVTPTLPKGLGVSVDASNNCVISGTPIAAIPQKSFTIEGYVSTELNLPVATSVTNIKTLDSYCSPSQLVSAKNTNPIEKYQWHLDGDTSQTNFGMKVDNFNTAVNLNLNNSWRTDGCQGQNILVSVIDSGLEIAHPDLAANIHPSKGFDFTSLGWNYQNPDPISGDLDPTPIGSSDGDHGTSVAGLIAMADNNIGGLGVAPKAQLLGFNFLNPGTRQHTNYLAYSYGVSANSPATNADIINASYGTSTYYMSATSSITDSMINDRIINGRSGKGAIIVKSSGNSYSEIHEQCRRASVIKTSCQRAGSDPEESLPIIVTAAINAGGVRSSYSTAGAIWVSGFGGEFGQARDRAFVSKALVPTGEVYFRYMNKTLHQKPAMLTTDVTSCSKGYSKDTMGFVDLRVAGMTRITYNDASKNDFEYIYSTAKWTGRPEFGFLTYINVTAQGDITTNPQGTALVTGPSKPHPENPSCNYTSVFNGTSSAAPVVSGVVALLLSQHPDLTIWDVRYILAKTAKKIDPSYKVTAGISYIGNYNFSNGWITNKAGLNYSDWYGFGLVDADAALAMAKTYSKLITHSRIKTTSKESANNLNLIVPNKNITGATSSLSIAENGIIDHINLYVDLSASSMQDIEIQLRSPSGTVYNVYHAGSGDEVPNLTYSQRLVTNAFLGESVNGNWTIRIKDLFNNKDFGINNKYADNANDKLNKWKLEIKYHEED